MDVALLGLAGLTLYGYERSKHSVYNILQWGGNSGDINTATGKNTDVGLPNTDPNWAGSGRSARQALIPPYPPPVKTHLNVDLPTHPSEASTLVKELRSYASDVPFQSSKMGYYGGLPDSEWGFY